MLGDEFSDRRVRSMSLREDLCARVNLLVKEVRKGSLRAQKIHSRNVTQYELDLSLEMSLEILIMERETDTKASRTRRKVEGEIGAWTVEGKSFEVVAFQPSVDCGYNGKSCHATIVEGARD